MNDEQSKSTEEQEKNFRKWMSTQPSAIGKPLTSGSVSNNAIAIRKICTEMSLDAFPEITNLYSVTELDLFSEIRQAIMTHPDYERLNRKHGNGYLNTALTIWYEGYLKWLAGGGNPDTLEDGSSINALADNTNNDSPYTAENFLSEVYMPKEDYDILVAVLMSKKNIILQGAPGVGKTFAAKRLVYSIMGKRDKERVMMVQFHQSYSYEDFIMGFRPSMTGFELKRGAFYKFCKKAEKDSDNDYFFIIDEINRGNLSKIFGELFMLIETDKRGIELQLLYSDEQFSVPENVYIIGMMNTADRSLAMLDYALRRRFAFFEMKPGFDSDGFREYQSDLGSDKFNRLINRVKELNEAIAADESLGEGFCIGHSFFCNLEEATYQDLSGIVEFELIPLLKEYWFDEPDEVRTWVGHLRNAIK